MSTRIETFTVNRNDLRKLIDSLSYAEHKKGFRDTDPLITLGIEIDHIQGDKVLWVSNSKHDEKRIVIKREEVIK